MNLSPMTVQPFWLFPLSGSNLIFFNFKFSMVTIINKPIWKFSGQRKRDRLCCVTLLLKIYRVSNDGTI